MQFASKGNRPVALPLSFLIQTPKPPLSRQILQRVYKFGGQVRYSFSEKHSKAMMHATAGSLIGVGEIVLLPLGEGARE
ncbi:unnamed protein product [Phaeothamnion confervicola]